MIITICCLLQLTSVRAQTFAEWFKQNATQKKYLAEQIAALKVYQQYLSKGYTVAKDGLQNIRGFKSGEFGLHGDYFKSLKSVHPAIAHSQKVKDIIAIQASAAMVRSKTLSQISGSDLITSEEQAYIRRVLKRISDECDQTLEELELVTENGKLEMTDDERIKRIDLLYERSQSHFRVSKNFQASTFQLVESRRQHRADIETSKSINGIKN